MNKDLERALGIAGVGLTIAAPFVIPTAETLAQEGLAPTPVPTEVEPSGSQGTQTVLYRAFRVDDPASQSHIDDAILASVRRANNFGVPTESLDTTPETIMGANGIEYQVPRIKLLESATILGIEHNAGSLVVPINIQNSDGTVTEFIVGLNDPDGKDEGYYVDFLSLTPNSGDSVDQQRAWPAVFTRDREGNQVPVSVLEIQSDAAGHFSVAETPVYMANATIGNGNFRPVDNPTVPDGGTQVGTNDRIIVIGNDQYSISGVNATFRKIVVNGKEGYFAETSLDIKPQARPPVRVPVIEETTLDLSEEEKVAITTEVNANLPEAFFTFYSNEIGKSITIDYAQHAYQRVNPETGRIAHWRANMTADATDIEGGWYVPTDARFTTSEGTTVVVEFSERDGYTTGLGTNYRNVAFTQDFVTRIAEWVNNEAPSLRGKTVIIDLANGNLTTDNVYERGYYDSVMWTGSSNVIQAWGASTHIGDNMTIMNAYVRGAGEFFSPAEEADEVLFSTTVFGSLTRAAGKSMFGGANSTIFSSMFPNFYHDSRYAGGTKLVDLNR